MPVLKFETKIVNGKPIISFGSEQLKNPTKKSDYKFKNQKYPLRVNSSGNTISNEISLKNQPKISYENELFDRKKSSDQIIKPNKPNQNTEIPLSDKAMNYIHNYRSSLKQTAPKESLFNFLKNDQKIPQKKHDNINEYSTYNNNNNNDRQIKSDSLTEDDIDEVMKQIVLENKNLLSEEQLVDVLAKLYLDAKINKKQKVEIHQTPNEIVDWKPKKAMQQHFELQKNEENNSMYSKPEEKQNINRLINNDAPITTGLTALQKKQLQWDRERKEMAEISSYNPWGKPGCGAPTKSSVENRQTDNNYSPKPVSQIVTNTPLEPQKNYFSPGENVSQSELKRQQWLTELNEQVAEKERRKYMENPSGNPTEFYRSKINSIEDPNLTHGRGKGLADLNQMSHEEIVQKRNKQLEQQEAIRRQIEEKEIQKRLEREKKAQLDQEEENRILREKLKLDTQYLSETARIKQKDDESGKRLAQQRLQLEAAERSALMDKKLKRLQRLELAGHDTRQLRAGLIAEQMSGRLGDSLELRSEDNSLKQLNFEKPTYEINPSPRSYFQHPITEDQAVQTDNYIFREYQSRPPEVYDPYVEPSSHRHRVIESTKQIKQNKSATETTNRKPLKPSNKQRPSSSVSNKSQLTNRVKKLEPVEARRPWGTKKISKKYVPQSKRDPFYASSQETREVHKQQRVNKILSQVKANMDRIPEIDANDGRMSQRHKKCENQQISDHDKENYEVNNGTYELKGNSYRDDDRVQGQVIYKDTYRQSTKPNNSSRQIAIIQDAKKSPEISNDWWTDPNHEIIRTTDILNPALADQILPFSRENTGRERARQGYYKNQNPAQFGEPLKSQSNNPNFHSAETNKRDSFYNIPTQPTQRQNTILKQLSDIREGLLMKQKEIETSLSINADI